MQHNISFISKCHRTILEYGDSQHDLYNNYLYQQLRCEYCKLNADYEMHVRLLELAKPSDLPLCQSIDIDNPSHNLIMCLCN